MTFWIPEFRARILEQGARLWRDMPWRNIDDPYGVLVSEVMLQQTQVARVMERWEAWMRRFPTVDSLAAAGNADVLEAWLGLGYNRRALNLKRACEACSRENGGRVPETVEDLERLPGVGPATAAGVVAFAYDRPAVYLETNVRAVFIHEFFPDEAKVSDAELRPLVAAACPDTGVRQWYYALLDVGAACKASLPAAADPSRRSASYGRQSSFEGSHRQKRAALLRMVLAHPGITEDAAFEHLCAAEEAAGRVPVSPAEYDGILAELAREGFLARTDGTLTC